MVPNAAAPPPQSKGRGSTEALPGAHQRRRRDKRLLILGAEPRLNLLDGRGDGRRLRLACALGRFRERLGNRLCPRLGDGALLFGLRRLSRLRQLRKASKCDVA